MAEKENRREQGPRGRRARGARGPRLSREEREIQRKIEERESSIANWVPKTEAGRAVKGGEIESLDQYFQRFPTVMEPQIVDMLVPDLRDKLVDFTKTTKVRRAGRMFSFRASVIVGDGKSYVGVGTGKDKERWPAIRKAANAAKLRLVKVRKGSGSWEEQSSEPHSVPFKVTGKCASVRVTLLPSPKGTGLVAGDNIKGVLQFAGVKNVWCQTKGSTGTKLNFVEATIDALSKTAKMRMSEDFKAKLER